MKEYYKKRGPLGYYGMGFDDSYNEKVKKLNKIIDEHNRTINTFDTEKENEEFYEFIQLKIKTFLK